LYRHNQPKPSALKFIDQATPAPPTRSSRQPTPSHGNRLGSSSGGSGASSSLSTSLFGQPPKLAHRLVQMLTAMMASPFFQQLSPDVKSLIAHSCEHRYVSARQPLYIEGDHADFAYFLLSGSCSEHVRSAKSDPNETPQPTTRASTSTPSTSNNNVAALGFGSYTEREYSARRQRKPSISIPSSTVAAPPSPATAQLASPSSLAPLSSSSTSNPSNLSTTSSTSSTLSLPPGSPPAGAGPGAARTTPQILAPLSSAGFNNHNNINMGQPAAARLLTAPLIGSPHRGAVGTSKFGASPTLAIIREQHRGLTTPRSPSGGNTTSSTVAISSARSATSAATTHHTSTSIGTERAVRVLGPLPPPDSGQSPPDVDQLFGRCVRVLAPPDFFGFDQPHFVPPPLPTTMTPAAAQAAAVLAGLSATSIMISAPGITTASHTRHASVSSAHGTHTRRGSTASQPELRRPPVLTRQSSVITREPCRVLRVNFHWLADLLWRLASPLMPYWPLRLAVHAVPAARSPDQKTLVCSQQALACAYSS
jgi:hypothetical protein